MNKKRNFAKLALLSALLCGLASPTFVGCKDYDDDIKDLQEQVDANKTLIASIQEAIANKKFISDYVAIANGYELKFSDGSTLQILNGERGEQGLQGIQGIQGPQGEPGVAAAAIIPQFRVNGGYWEVSVDKGESYQQVLDDKQQPVKATPDATEGVSINDEGYLVIGTTVTKLNVDPKCPAITYNEENKTFMITVDGHSMVIPEEGSDYNGLQALIYRKMHVDDIEDYVLMGSLSYTPTEPAGAEPILLINSKGMAEFKVLPKTFDTKKATYEFFDTHISRTEKDPIALTYVDGSAKVNDGILSVEFTSSNLVEGYYLSSMNVTLNKNTACSDYFAVRVKDYKVNEAVFFIQTADVKVEADQVDDMLAGTLTNDPYHYEFVYTESYSVQDSIALGFEEGEGFKSLEELNFGAAVEVSYAPTEEKENGIFQIDPKTGVITVAKDKQASAINEFCYVTITYTFKDQEGKEVTKVTKDVAIKAVLASTSLSGVEILANDGKAFNFMYSVEKQIIELDVRDFEAKMGGRNILNPSNEEKNSRVWKLGYIDENNAIKSVTRTLPANAQLPLNLESDDVVGEGDMYLYFYAGTDEITSRDALYLIIGAKTRFDKNTLFAITEDASEKAVINNKNFYLKDVEVKRNVVIALKEEYKPLTMTGVWNSTTDYKMISENLNLMYDITPADLQLAFILAEEQSEEVQELIDNGQLLLDVTTNKITIDPRVDLSKKQLYVNYDIFDKTEAVDTRKPLASDKIMIQNPVGKLTGTVKQQTFQVVNLDDTYNTVNESNKTLTLEDVRKNKLLTYTKANATADDAKYTLSDVAKNLYGTIDADFGIEYTIDKAAEDFGITINEGVLGLDANKISSGMTFNKTVTVTMTITHDWGTTSVSYEVIVKKAN